jgi:hypothetical protein
MRPRYDAFERGRVFSNVTQMLMTTLQETGPPLTQPTFGAAPPFAPRPQTLSATPILTQQIDAEEPEVIRCLLFVTITHTRKSDLRAISFFYRKWRERQADEIKARDERSKARRQDTISKAERSIDQFYEEYTGKRERQIRENKYVLSLPRCHLV